MGKPSCLAECHAQHRMISLTMPQEFDDILIKVRFSFPIDSDAMNVSNQTHGCETIGR